MTFISFYLNVISNANLPLGKLPQSNIENSYVGHSDTLEDLASKHILCTVFAQ